VKQIKIKCPKCGFGRSVPTKSLPDKPRFKALCPKCEERFSVELRGSKNPSRSDFIRTFSKKSSLLAMAGLLVVVALSAFYLGRKTNTEEVVPVAIKPPVEVEIARVEKPIEVKEQVKDEPQAVTLQCSGEARMVDYSPSTSGSSEDHWEAGPWQFTDVFRLAQGDKGHGTKLFLESRDEFVVLECSNPEEHCADQYEVTDAAVKYTMKLGRDKNLFTRELTIDRNNGAFHHMATMTGGRMRNSVIQTGGCKELTTGATSF
jgi:hypothetical protein